MNTKKFSRSSLALASLTLLVLSGGGSSGLSVTSQTKEAPVAEERTHKVSLAPRMRAVVDITEVRNLKSENWLQDLEIEIENTSSKPIFFLLIVLSFPDLPPRFIEGAFRNQVIILEYGNRRLMKRNEFANSEDVPINPSEKFTFKIPESNWKGLESVLGEMNILKSSIKTINIRVYEVSHGDGTGVKLFNVPFSHEKTSSYNSFPRDGPPIELKKTASYLKPCTNKRIAPPNIKPASYTTNSINPMFDSCGPPQSGCANYEEVVEDCPTTEHRCGSRMYWRGHQVITPTQSV
jgi:hypothetical protein